MVASDPDQILANCENLGTKTHIVTNLSLSQISERSVRMFNRLKLTSRVQEIAGERKNIKFQGLKGKDPAREFRNGMK